MTDKAEVLRAEHLWIVASTLGALVGAALAHFLFSGVGFDRNPVGQFSDQAWFAATIGLCFGVAQAGVLVCVVKGTLAAKLVLFLLWVGASTAGTVFTLLPLWWVDPDLLGYFLFLIFVPMLPGIIVLAVLQGLILTFLFSAVTDWLPRTGAGGIVGAVLGLGVGFVSSGILFDSFVWQEMSMEIIWAAVFGGSIGIAQNRELEML